MNFIRNRNFRAGPQTSLEGFICPQNSDKQQKIKVFGRSGGVRILNYKSVFIGEDCYFDTLAPECIIIENNVLITKGCSVLTHYYDFKQKKFTYGEQLVIFKEHCFIGWNVTICKPVTIGKYSVVGAGSVVTKDIPDYEVWAGNPAKFIRKIEH